MTLFLTFCAFSWNSGQPGQHELEHTAEFARLHHVDEELVKNLRMLRESLGERAAALHGIGELIDRVFEHRVAFLFCENI